MPDRLPNSNIPGINRAQGDITGQKKMSGATSATLSVRIGQDGIDGKDGFSPTITVEKETKLEYILRITDVNGSYLTPNLFPDLGGAQDIQSLVATKIDEDLKEYPVINPINLTTEQRKETYLYTNSVGLNRKLQISEFALETETEEKIKKKLQTVDQVPKREEWKVGDYILLDNIPTEKQ